MDCEFTHIFKTDTLKLIVATEKFTSQIEQYIGIVKNTLVQRDKFHKTLSETF